MTIEVAVAEARNSRFYQLTVLTIDWKRRPKKDTQKVFLKIMIFECDIYDCGRTSGVSTHIIRGL